MPRPNKKHCQALAQERNASGFVSVPNKSNNDVSDDDDRDDGIDDRLKDDSALSPPELLHAAADHDEFCCIPHRLTNALCYDTDSFESEVDEGIPALIDLNKVVFIKSVDDLANRKRPSHERLSRNKQKATERFKKKHNDLSHGIAGKRIPSLIVAFKGQHSSILLVHLLTRNLQELSLIKTSEG